MNTLERTSYESVLAVVFLLLLIHYFFPQPFLIPIIIGFTLLTLLSSVVANWVHLFWTRTTQGIGSVMNKLLLGFIFFFLLSPIAILYRAFRGKTPSKTDSNFIDRNRQYQADDLTNPW